MGETTSGVGWFLRHHHPFRSVYPPGGGTDLFCHLAKGGGEISARGRWMETFGRLAGVFRRLQIGDCLLSGSSGIARAGRDSCGSGFPEMPVNGERIERGL
jgi:hypothetical protein